MRNVARPTSNPLIFIISFLFNDAKDFKDLKDSKDPKDPKDPKAPKTLPPNLRPQEVPQVPNGQDGVVQEHAGTGIAHHLPYLLAHVRFVAMHGASGATGLVLAKAAMLQALNGIIQQCLALRTERGNGENGKVKTENGKVSG